MASQNPFRRGRPEAWTPERIAQLSAEDIKQLRQNAERLNEPDVVALCTQALSKASRTTRAGTKSGHGTKARRLIARQRAFEARGVWLDDARTSWGGLRKSDGAVVIALWAASIESTDGTCSCLLWAPNIDGARPWSDAAAGRERLTHCKRAMELGRAEGLLVYGDRLVDHLPEERAYAVHGVDPETVIVFQVEMRGAEYWATWGRRSAR